MTKKNGLEVRKVRAPEQKAWVRVITYPAEGARIAFEDLFDIVRLIIECEIEKYETNGRTPEQAWERWADMPRRVLEIAATYGANWDAVADEFDLPRRDGARAPKPVLDLGWFKGEGWE